jgi:hypothetical protein
MKNKFSLLLIVILFTSAFSTCKKKNTEDPPTSIPVQTISILTDIKTEDAYCANLSMGQQFFILPDSSYSLIYSSYVTCGEPLRIVNYSKNGPLNWEKQYSYHPFVITSSDSISGGGYMVLMRDGLGLSVYNLVLKVNQQGDSVWKHDFPGRFFDNIEVMDNGNICLLTTQYSKPYILMLNPNGDSISSFSFGDSLTTMIGEFRPVFNNNNNDFVFCYNLVNPQNVSYFVKVDYLGNIIWEKTIPNLFFSFISLYPDGSMIGIANNNSDNKANIVTLSATGNIISQFTVSNSPFYGAVTLMDDGNYLIGTSKLTKVSSSGTILWSQDFYSSMGGATINCQSLFNNPGNAYTLFGTYNIYASNQVLILKFKLE